MNRREVDEISPEDLEAAGDVYDRLMAAKVPALLVRASGADKGVQVASEAVKIEELWGAEQAARAAERGLGVE